MNWIDIRKHSIVDVNAEIKKCCEIYAVSFLELKLKKQRLLVPTGTEAPETETTSQRMSEVLLEKLHPGWGAAPRDQLLHSLHESMTSRLSELDSYLSDLDRHLSAVAQSPDSQSSSAFSRFQRLTRDKGRLKGGRLVLSQTLSEYPWGDIEELDERLRDNVVAEPSILQPDFWDRDHDDDEEVQMDQLLSGVGMDVTSQQQQRVADALLAEAGISVSTLPPPASSTSSPSSRPLPSSFGLGDVDDAVASPSPSAIRHSRSHLEQDFDAAEETEAQSHANERKNVIYRILLTPEEFEMLKERRRRQFDTERFLLKGEGTLNERSRIPLRARQFVGGGGQRRRSRRDDVMERAESKYLFSTEPYVDPPTVFSSRTHGESLRTSESHGNAHDGMSIAKTLRGGAGVQVASPSQSKKGFSSVTRSLTTGSLDKTFVLGERYDNEDSRRRSGRKPRRRRSSGWN